MTGPLYPLLHMVIAMVAVIIWVALNALLLVYLERKFAGHIQRRPGPYEVGPHGILQTLIDGVKLMGKQLIRPNNVDPWLYYAAPILSFLPVVLVFLPIPYGRVLTGMEVDLGLLLILAFSGINVL
ncbi:MAG: NADH-quinone oxidoreductase subunit H, partial [Desulfovibrionaceae bacterium]